MPFSKKSEYEYKPAITIKDDAKKLKSGKDYIITYENNTQDNVVKYMNNDADAKHPTVTLIFPEESSYCFKDKEGKVLEKTVMPLRIYKNVLKKSELYVIVDDYTYSGKQIKPDGNSVRVYLGSAQNVKYVIENNVIDDASLREYGFIRFEQNKDYIIEDYGNNIFAGINSGKLKITGISKEYGGSVTVKFKILSKGIYKGKLN